jgi:rod shape-determining protein MreD
MVQAILPSWSAMGQAKPPLLLAAVLFYALGRSHGEALETAVVAGLLQDSLGPIPHGTSVLAFTSVALVINHYRERVFADHWFTHAMMGIGASAWVTLSLYILLTASGLRTGVGLPFVLSKALGMSLLGLVVMPLIYSLISRIHQALGIQPGQPGGLLL